ncbi:MAG: hypothetical protein R3250_04405 [Melioribacteraceae bacterium]|nr:hypothetical protein [Melioribacteraceae bacterium]
MKLGTEYLRKTSIEEIAEDLLAAAHMIHTYHISIALGGELPENFEKGNKEYQQRILDAVKPMLDSYEQVKEISAKNSDDVITLLKRGKIKPKEAIELLKLVKMKAEVEVEEMENELKKQLLEAVDEEEEEDII